MDEEHLYEAMNMLDTDYLPFWNYTSSFQYMSPHTLLCINNPSLRLTLSLIMPLGNVAELYHFD